MKYLVYSLSIIVALVSCKKLQDVESSEDKLRGGNWKLTSASATYEIPYSNPAKDSTVNITDSMKECQKDDYLVFGDNYNGYVATNEKKCTPGEPQQLGFNWGLQENDTKMYIYNAAQTFGTPSVNAEVSNFSNNSITLKYYYTFEYPELQHPNRMIADTIFVTTTFSK